MHTSHGDELWKMHTGLSPNGLAQLIDLDNVPRKMKEVEKKYRFSSDQKRIDYEVSSLFAKIGSLVLQKKLEIVSLTTFVGIDQYFIYESDGREFHFRYRSGANRPPQLTVKYQLNRGSNVSRGEINVDVAQADPSKVRAFMSVIAALAVKPPIMFVAQQSGNIWVVNDPISHKEVEIVAYRVRRFAPSLIEGVFAEIEPLEAHSVEDAFNVIDEYEQALELGPFVCTNSIAELFRPGNEAMLNNSIS